MELADTAYVGAVAGAGGAAALLLARNRITLVAGLVLLAAAEVALALSQLDELPTLGAVGPLAVAGAAVGGALVAAAALALARQPGLVAPAVLATAPFRLPLDFDPDHRFFVAVAEGGRLGRLLPLYFVLAAAGLALALRAFRGAEVAELTRLVSIPTAAFLAFAALSLLWSTDVAAGTNLLAFFLLPFAALVAVVGRSPFAPGTVRALATISVALALVFAIVGLYQAVTQRLLFFAPNLEVANAYTTFFRVTSLFRDPSLYGRHVVLGIAVVLVALWLRRLGPVTSAALIAVLFAGLYFSYSQSSLAALGAVTVAITLAAGDRTARRVLVVSGLVVLVAASLIVLPSLRDESIRRATSDRSRRVDLTARVVVDHPIVGVGLGAQPRASRAQSGVAGPDASFVSHTTPMTVAAELGLVGIALYVALLAGAAWLIELVRRVDVALGLALGGALLALFVHALFYSGFFEDPITWLVLGVAASALGARQRAEARAPVRDRTAALQPS